MFVLWDNIFDGAIRVMITLKNVAKEYDVKKFNSCQRLNQTTGMAVANVAN